MELKPWGALGTPYLSLPERSLGYMILALYAVLLVLTLLHRRRDFRQLNFRQWILAFLLVPISIACSQLFLISISTENQLPPLSSAQNPVAYLAPFGFAPLLFAGATLNPIAAVIVGFAAGLGRAMWQTHQLTDPFNYAFAALIAAYLMQQNYSGRLYALLRLPSISGIFGALLLLPLVGGATFVYANLDATNLEALDLALSTTTANILPLLVEGILGGAVVSLLLFGLPQLKPRRRMIPSPLSLSLNTRLVATFFLFAGLLSFLLVIIGFNLALRVATNLAVAQMARDAESVSTTIPDFRAHRQHLLVRTSENRALTSENIETRQAVLEQLFRIGPFFRSLMLIDDTQTIEAQFPEDETPNSLSNLERIAVEDALQTGAPYISPAQELEDGSFFLSFIVPVYGERETPQAVLIGRVPDVSLEELVVALQGTLVKGVGFLLDEQGQIIGHPEPVNLLKSWEIPGSDQQILKASEQFDGLAYEGLQGSTNARQIVYYLHGPDHPWGIVITVPYEVILEQALQIAVQLAIVLGAAVLLFGFFLLWLGRSITKPLMDLALASQKIADGSLNTSINPQGDDEIGRLGQAFNQMQMALKRRLDELSLLLGVSQDVSKSIDINRGMPSVLKGALRGTGASGARVVVLNPSGRQPLLFGEGPASSKMAQFDRQIMVKIRQQKELILASPMDVGSILQNGHEPDILPKAIVALPLATNGRFQGVFWLAYRQAHDFDQTELSFLRTLSGQASVLVENARLYATAEGGRRRLAAVLASTTDAVIVTDQTERVLLINPAMERFFDLSASNVVGRPVKNVLKIEPLVNALTGDSRKTHNIEIQADDGRVFYASVSTIFNNEGQAIGRVAVLHDITYLKEIDEMKSEFVATVSHDLRSPLTFMLGYATMLSLVGDLEPKQQEYVNKIVGGIEQMSGLIEDLLGLGRLEAGVDLVLGPLRIQEILESVLEEYRQHAMENGIELAAICQQKIPMITADGSLIRQAVANFVNNAIKYAPNSGPVIIEAALGEGEVVVSVSDNGPGLTTKDQLRVFEKFYRVKRRGTERTKGSGLGLAIVRSIADRHNGRAWCESRLGEGSTFFLALPLNKSD